MFKTKCRPIQDYYKDSCLRLVRWKRFLIREILSAVCAHV